MSWDAAGPQQNTIPVGPSLSESSGPNPHSNISGCFSWNIKSSKEDPFILAHLPIQSPNEFRLMLISTGPEGPYPCHNPEAGPIITASL